MAGDLHIDPRNFQSAMRRALEYSKRGPDAILREQARGFVSLIVQVTPPGSEGVKGSQAKRQGEQAISIDLGRVGTPVTGKRNGTITDAAAFAALHKSRRGANGRVLKSSRPVPVATGVFRAYLKQQKEKVGKLASGWNAAASALGVRLPAWVTRHGATRGQIRIRTSFGNRSITITNSVRYVGSVKDLARRVQWTLDTRAEIMERRTRDYLAKLKRNSGL